MKFFSYYKSEYGWWFRICGYGLTGKDLREQGLTFSQRNGYRKYLRIGNWCISFLKP